MSDTTALCITKTREQAATIVNDLKVAGFANNDISALFPDTAGSRDFAHEAATKAPEGTAVGASSGAILGRARGGWRASAPWRFRASAPSSPPARSWRRSAARRSAAPPVVSPAR